VDRIELLESRLRQADQTVLKDVFHQLRPGVQHSLAAQFQGSLSSADLDDVMSTALFRLWTTRDRFDPKKGSLTTWYYLLAKSAALDLLRKNPRREVRWDDETEVGASLAYGSSAALSASTPTRPLTGYLASAIADLSAIDREVIVAFANSHDENWATNLSAELGIPASTIRSRKSRAIVKLRENFKERGIHISEKGNLMGTYAEKEIDRDAAQARSAAGSSFMHENELAIELLATRLRNFIAKRKGRVDSPGRIDRERETVQYAVHWNEALENEATDAQLKILGDTYRWLSAVEDSRSRYRRQLGEFLHSAVRAHSDARTTWERFDIDRLEKVMAGIGTAIEAAMPDDIDTEPSGVLRVEWNAKDGPELHWVSEKESSIRLRELATHCFVLNGKATRADAVVLAQSLLEGIASFQVLPPNLEFRSEDLEQGKLRQLLWTAPQIAAEKVAEMPLPEWTETKQPVAVSLPSDEELDLHREEPDAAVELVRLVAAAMVIDDRLGSEHRGEQSVIEALVKELATRTGLTTFEIAALAAPHLIADRNIRSPDHCRLSKAAVAKLTGLLSESGKG